METKIIYYDFKNKVKISEEENKQPVLDPVLEQVKKELSPENFEIYKRTIDNWMERNFHYQRENGLI
jgi:hypothetical protein